MTAPTPNTELAWRVLDHIDVHPETWRQGSWECGTTACFAGWAVRLSGGVTDGHETNPKVISGPEELIGLEIPEAADVVLRIDPEELNRLDLGDPYDGLLTRLELGERVEAIFGPRPAWTAADETAWRECAHRADYLTPAEHALNCAYHLGEVDEDGLPVDDVPPNAGSAS